MHTLRAPLAARPRSRCVIAVLVFLLGTFTPARSHAQQGVVTGTVVEGKTGQPLSDANIQIDGTRLGTRTDARGQFRLTGITTSGATLRVSRLGFLPRLTQVASGQTNVRIELEQKLLELEAMVVTGTVGATEVRALGNSLGQVSVNDIVKVAPPTKLQDMLSVNVPGVRIISAGGQIGTGGTTRIRGAGSLSLSNAPLVYVDGVRTDNANTDGNKAVAFNSGDQPSRINDLNPEEIESIEVIKGPAAAALYGTEAANGVIQIITKRGKVGKPQWDVRLASGANWLQDAYHKWNDAWFLNKAGEMQSFNVQQYNHDKGFPDVFQTGRPIGGGVALSGGTEALRYYASGDLNRDEGIVSYNWQNKFNGRGNLSYTQGNLQVDANYGLVRSQVRSGSAFQPITTSIVWACPSNDCANLPFDQKTDNTYRHGWPFYRPEDYKGTFGYDNEDRTILGLKVSHQLFSWLNHRVQLGADVGNNRSENLIYKDTLGSAGPFFGNSDGYKAVGAIRSTFYTVDYGANAKFTLFRNLESQTSAGAQYYQKIRQIVDGVGTHFSVPGPSDITGAATRLATEDYIPNKTVGVYMQEQLALNNRMFLTGAVRGDDNSAFGKNFNFVVYPKISGSWVVSEEPFLNKKIPFVQTLKLRAAYGRAGQQPDVFASLRQYQAVVGYQGKGTLTTKVIGNPDLKPEVGDEIEMGFDAGLFNERVSFELTHYDKKLNDAILSVPIRPSSGFPGSKFINIGQTENSGFELGLRTSVVQTKNVDWSVRGTYSTNDAKVNQLIPGTTNMFVGNAFIRQFNVVGYAPFSYFYKKVLTSNVLTEADPAKWTFTCEGGAAYTKGDGSSVSCDKANALYAGRPTPQWSGSLSTDLTLFKNFRFYALADMVGGNTLMTGDVTAAHEFFFNSKKAAASLQALTGNRKVIKDADARLAGIIYLADFVSDPDVGGSSGVLRNGFMKLRTVSASYSFPNGLARRFGATRASLTVSGENLATLWRAQSGTYGFKFVDPEISQNQDPNGLFSYQQEGWPQFQRVSFTLRLTY